MIRRVAVLVLVVGALAAGGCAPGSPGRVTGTGPTVPSGTPGPGTSGPGTPDPGAPDPGAPGPSGSSGASRPAPAGAASTTGARLAPDPSPACLESIEAVVERATGNRVLLGPAAFAASDELVLAPQFPRGTDGRLLDGRARAPAPVVFRLGQVAGQCQIQQVDPAGSLPASAGGSLTPPLPLSTAARQPVMLPECRCRSR